MPKVNHDLASRLFAFNWKDFEPLSDEYKRPGGVNSEIRYLQQPDGSVFVQARYGVKKGGFSYQEAVEMSQILKQYQVLLHQRGVHMPEITGISVEHDLDKDRAVIVKTARWTGYDLGELLSREVIARDHVLIRDLIGKMCQLISQVCRERHRGWETVVGIDTRCTNFTVDENEKMWFIDLFPARFREGDIPMVEWPTPKTEEGHTLGLFKHYDVRGIALCTISQLSRVRPELRNLFEEEVVRHFTDWLSSQEAQEFVFGLQNNPWKKVRDFLNEKRELPLEEFEKLQSEPVFGFDYGVYTLREIASEFAAKGVISKDELEEFYKASHFEDRLPEERLSYLRGELRGMYEQALGEV